MINIVIKFSNNIVLVLNEKGELMPKYQGRYKDVRAKILAHAPKSAEFFHGVWTIANNNVSRGKW